VAIAAGIENSENRFVRAALVPFLGGLFNLILIVVLAPPFGVFGIAVAATAGSVVQLLFFGNTLTRGGLMLRASVALPGVREAASLLWPLLISGVFVRLTILAERYFGSRLGPGSISEISYASSMIGPLAMILSIGVGTVLFPRMSQQSATGNLAELGTSLSLAIRAMWILIAPVILIGICLSRPAMEALLEGGRVTAEETGHVALLLQVYLLGVAAAALGIVTGRVLYSLKAAHLLSIAGAIEGIAYVLYTALLVGRLGAAGVAWGFVIYVSASVCWHLAAITHRIHWRLWRTTAWSAVRTTAAAIAAAGVARFVTGQFAAPWTALLLAGGASVVTFVIVLAMINRPDVNLMTSALTQLKGRRQN
jgi:putative peptidoglycan lipid II flippase